MTLTEIIGRLTEKLEMKGLDQNFFLSAVSMTIDRVIETLARGEEVKIRGLGRLYWAPALGRTKVLKGKRHTVPAYLRLRFEPADALRRREMVEKKEDEGMTKLGVEMDPDKVKTATESSSPHKCAVCGKPLDDAGVCPEHGTEPLERK